MNARDFFLILIAVAGGAFIALIIWTLIVKQQLSSTVTGNSTLGAILSLFGSRPAASTSP